MFVPSVLAHIVGGGVLVIAVIFLFLNSSRIFAFDTYRILIVMLLFSMAIGVHGLSHLGLEKIYGYSPLHVFFKKHGSKEQDESNEST